MATPAPATDDATAAAPASAEDQSSLFTGDLDAAALAEQAAAMEAALASMEETLETNEMDRQEEASYFTVAAKITTDADEDGDDDDDDGDNDVVNIESIAMKAFATMMTTNMFDEEEEEFRNQVSEDLAQRKEAQQKEQQKEQQEREKQQQTSGSNNHGRNKVVLEVTDDEHDEQSAADSEDEDEAANDNMSIDDSVGSEEEDPSLDASSSSSASGATSASGKSAATSASESSAATSASEKSAATSASEKSDAASAGSASDEEGPESTRKSLRASTTNASNNLHASFNSSSLHRSKGSLQSSSRSLSIFEIQDPDLETDNNDSDEVLLKHGILRVDESSTDQAFICDWDRWRKWKKRKRENDTSSNSNRMEDSSQRWGDDSSVRQSDSNLRMPRRRTSESTHTSASEANLYETDNLTIESTTTTGGEDGGGPCFDWKAWRRRQLSSTSRTSVSSSLGGDDFDEGSVLQKLNEWEVLEESMRSLTSVDDDEYADEADFSLEHTDLRRSSDPGKKAASLNRANSEVFSTKRTSMPARANSDKNLKKHRASSDRNLSKKHQSTRRSTSPRRKQAKSPVGDSWKKWQRDKRRSGITKRSYSERNISLSGDSDDDTFDGDDHHEDDEPSQQRIQLTKSQSEKWKEGADNDKKSKRRGRFQRAQSERFNLNDKAPAIPGKKGFRRAQSWDSCKLANAEQVFDWKTWRKDKRKTMKKSSSDRPFRKQKSDKSLSKSLHG